MPELPEVETMRRGILSVVGQRITAAERPPCERRPITLTPRFDAFRRRTEGRLIQAVDRLGKRVVIRLDSHDAIVIEPRMTGLVLLADPPTQEHLRLRLRFEMPGRKAAAKRGAGELLFWDRRGLGVVRLLAPAEFDTYYGPDRLGPDALEISAALLRERLAPSRRAIKVALLDQRAVLGIGNLYASEILHLCRIHPERRCDQLRAKDWPALHAAMVQVLETAILFEGSTLADGTYRNALNQSGSYQNEHRVYDRAKQPCLGCGTVVVRIVQAQRSTFYCPTCQRR